MAHSQVKQDEIEKVINALSPEERVIFDEAMVLSRRKRRWTSIGYTLAVCSLLIGVPIAAYLYSDPQGTKPLWPFLIPFALAGFWLVVFSKGAKREGRISTVLD